MMKRKQLYMSRHASQREERPRKDRSSILYALASCGLNLVLFLIDMMIYNPVFATNDDYRMMLIACGAYMGKPSDELVYIRFPVRLILPALYRITSAVPWYGIFTVIMMYIPSCVLCYFILRKKIGGNGMTGLAVYLFVYAFILQKHVLLPQFTLTAAFLAMAALVLFWYLPEKARLGYVAAIVCFALLSASYRLRVLFMFLPFFPLIAIAKISPDKGARKLQANSFLIVFALILAACGLVAGADRLTSRLSEDYRAFNVVRSSLYDYGQIPPYFENRDFYIRNEIDYTMYYALSARYVDLDENISAEKISAIVDYRNAARYSEPIPILIAKAFLSSFSQFLSSLVIYQTIFLIIFFVIAVSALFSQKKYHLFLPMMGAAAFIEIEMIYFCYIGRIMDRLTDILILILTVFCVFALSECRDAPTGKPDESAAFRGVRAGFRRLFGYASLIIVLACLLFSNQSAISNLSQNQNDLNERLEILNMYAENHPENFYFYDAYDFIASSSDIFARYSGIVNTESLGNWYINSNDYFSRNAVYGFQKSFEGLTDPEKNVYYVCIGTLKNGVIYLLKDQYNAELALIETIPYYNNNLSVYMVVPG